MAESELSDKDFKKFCQLVYEHSHICLGERKRMLVRTRLGKVMRQRGIEKYADYYDFVVSDNSGDAVREMINAISTNLTQFFRENQHFEYLKKTYIPNMLQRKSQAGNRRIRIWSAGCSTGEEPYTISIVMNEILPSVRDWDLKILATDIDSNVLAHGMKGVYKKKQVESVPGSILQKYFVRTGDRHDPAFEAQDSLKRFISFRRLNLMREQYPFSGPFDFIFCRNVMIYFNRETQETLVSKFYNLLANGGVLLVGHSESLTGIQHGFKYVQPTIYQK